MDLRQIIREELAFILNEGLSHSFYSKLRDLIAPDGKIEKYFDTKKIINWPKVPNSDGNQTSDKDLGTLDLENNEYISIDKNKLCLVTGGDWQDSWYVEVVNSPKGLKTSKYVRADSKGGYKTLTKNRMKYDEMVRIIYSDHPMNKSIDEYIKEIKSCLKDYYPWDNSYGDEQYEEKIVEWPKFDKKDSTIYVVWKIGGHDKALMKPHTDINDKEISHEDFIKEKFEDWLKERFWYEKGKKFNLKGKEYKISCGVESLGNDMVKYFINIK